MNEVVEVLPYRGRPTLKRLGNLLRDNSDTIQKVQWFVVIFYLTLLIWPALLPLPKDYVHFYDNIVLFAQFIFWGIWWPFVILSMMIVGRVWCGVFCPEGALTEWSSRYGLGRAIPKWMRWTGWPFVAFVLTTIYGQLVSVYEYPKATLLILGGSTVAAMLVGFIYGRGKRVWCRHLCPANGVFSLLSRLAPIHFQVDKKIWDMAPKRTAAVDCPTLINIRNMTGNNACHMCGRCSGQRDAVTLTKRSPNAEILANKTGQTDHWEVLLLVIGLLGVATGAFQWSASPWFVSLKQGVAGWLIENKILWMFDDTHAWWILTYYPETNDVFSWLDGITIVSYIAGSTLCIGGLIMAGLWSAGKILKSKTFIPWELGYCLVPLAGLSVFLGLSSLTISMLNAERLNLVGIAELRGVLLVVAYLWSGYLLWQKLASINTTTPQKLTAWLVIISSSSLVAVSWIFVFYIW